MRGSTTRQVTFLSVTTDQLVAADHPIRRVKPFVEAALAELSPVFDQMYAQEGRPSIPPEHLLKAGLLMAFYSIRSERQFCERLQYDLLFKWFLDMNVEDPAFDQSSFAKNRERLLDHEVSRAFFAAGAEEARERLVVVEGHVLMENRNGLVVDVEVTQADGYAERSAGLAMLRRTRGGRSRRTVGADKGYDTRDFVQGCRELEVTPHVAQNQNERRSSAIDG